MQLFSRSLRPPKEDQKFYLQYEFHQEIWEVSANVNNYFLLFTTHSFTISSSKPGVFRPVTFWQTLCTYINSTVIKGFHAFDVLSVHIHSMYGEVKIITYSSLKYFYFKISHFVFMSEKISELHQMTRYEPLVAQKGGT